MNLRSSFHAFSILFFPNRIGCRSSSATLTMVICNVASMICLVQGMVLFNDSQFQHPLALVGMTINLIGGVWYTTSQVGIIEDSDKKAVVYKDIHREGSPK